MSTPKPLTDNPVIIIAGPTGSGKSGLAIELAEFFQIQKQKSEIICADSITVYKGFEIGSAKPSLTDRKKIPHHLLDVANPDQAFTAGDFVKLAGPLLEKMHQEKVIPIIAGGTGFYLRALLKGMVSDEENREASKAIRDRLDERAKNEGWDALYHELLAKDPGAAVTVHANDHYRVLRALQAIELYKKPWSELNQAARAAPPKFPGMRFFCLNWEREKLRERIRARTKIMLGQGLVEEVRELLTHVSAQAKPMQSVGYKECLEFLEGKLPEAMLEEKIIQETMRLAKSQMTWFRGEDNVEWIEPDFHHLQDALML